MHKYITENVLIFYVKKKKYELLNCSVYFGKFKWYLQYFKTCDSNQNIYHMKIAK